MNRTEKLSELRRLQTKVDALRQELGISAPDKIIYQAGLNPTSDDILLVEADGFGGATTIIIGGNYPLDYNTKFEQHFQTEAEAEGAAEEIASHKRTPRQILATLG